MILNMITRLSELTEVDGSMTPLEELDDTTKGLESWHGAGCIDLVVNPLNSQSPLLLQLSSFRSALPAIFCFPEWSHRLLE